MSKYVCSGDGTDCPCHSKEKSRPPAKPVTTGPVKITLASGETKWLCKCGESKNYVCGRPLAAGGCAAARGSNGPAAAARAVVALRAATTSGARRRP